MTAPIVQIVWLHQRLFFFVVCLTFLALGIVAVMLPKRATVRSAIEIGSAIINDRPDPFEPPEQVARQIPAIYGDTALLAMAKKGISPSILSALKNLSVESIGRSVVMVNTIDPSLENEAKEFQQTIADHIIEVLAARARALRESIAARISLATRASENLEQQIRADTREIERISALSDDLRGQLENERANLAALYQRTGMALQSGESTAVEAQIRELREQIKSQTSLTGSLALERSNLIRDFATTRHLYDAQARALAEAQFEQNSFDETRISLQPTLTSATTTATSRLLSLLLVAFVVSLLVALGAVLLLHNVAERKT
jgi:hypothetical protein